jgi:hypothetical protein
VSETATCPDCLVTRPPHLPGCRFYKPTGGDAAPGGPYTGLVKAGPSLPEPGRWPCQTPPQDVPQRVVALFYRLMRDHLPTGALEQLLIDMGEEVSFTFTNPHLENLSASLATRLLHPKSELES